MRDRSSMAETTSPRTTASLQAGYGNTRIIALLTACFMLGAGTSAVVYYVKGKHKTAAPKTPHNLSGATTRVLASLDSPVDVRFYSLVDSADGPTKNYAERVSALLDAYENAAPDKLSITKYASASDQAANAAVADGMLGFNREKGEVAYLGIAVSSDAQKEAIPQLRPEWETALEADLTRAISQVSARVAAARRQVGLPQVDTQAQAVVKQVFTNLSAVSMEEGTRTLRDSALEDFKRAAAEMQQALRAAEQRVLQAASPQEKAAAREALVQLQTRHSEKLQELASRSRAELQAFEELKREGK